MQIENILIQDEWGITVFKKFSGCSSYVILVDGMVAMGWQKVCKRRLFGRDEGTDANILTGQKELKVYLSQDIGRDDFPGDMDVVLDVEGPGIDHSKVFTWVYEECINLRIQICVQATKMGGTLKVEGPNQVPYICC